MRARRRHARRAGARCAHLGTSRGWRSGVGAMARANTNCLVNDPVWGAPRGEAPCSISGHRCSAYALAGSHPRPRSGAERGARLPDPPSPFPLAGRGPGGEVDAVARCADGAATYRVTSGRGCPAPPLQRACRGAKPLGAAHTRSTESIRGTGGIRQLPCAPRPPARGTGGRRCAARRGPLTRMGATTQEQRMAGCTRSRSPRP
jgi:hypothetical protein